MLARMEIVMSRGRVVASIGSIKRMKIRNTLSLSLSLIVFSLLGADAHAQNEFVYTHNNVAVSGFQIMPNGSLSAVPGSPFPTGNIDSSSGFFAVNRIVVSGDILILHNAVSGNITS
jgi:hypothetical protein